ncbi:MAG: cupredoxin family copper-binding protein [Candidatus Buchananbacteria bacterium]|nr:cupredoxin family copper-binding protein [Candidatus Buchananbacteria bacterium]
MNKRIYFLSLIVLPLLLNSCSYKAPATYTVPTSENENINQNTNQNSADQNTNKKTNVNVNTSVNVNTNTAVNTNVAKPKNINVTLSGFAFNPKIITIKKGDTIIWTNQDPVGHTVTSDPGSAVNFSSSTLDKGDTYRMTFNAVGTFNYHCSPHPSMTAQIIVTE